MRKYRLVAKKGEGTFSEVLKAQNIKDGKYRAIKCMKNRFESIDQVNNLREIQALRRLSPHEHIVALEEVLYDQPTGRLALVFELMDANLYELIKGRRHYLNPQLIKMYMWQLMKALDHMHRKGIFHRDIKPENILIESNADIGRGLKLADFGSCRGIYSKQPYTEYISTRWYRAPECLLTDGYYGPEMDLWGTGCVMFEITSLYPLFPGSNELDQINRIHKVLGTPNDEMLQKFKSKGASHISFDFPPQKGLGIPQLIPHAAPDAVDLIVKLIKYDASERISARESMRHPYFKEAREADAKRTSTDGTNAIEGSANSPQASHQEPLKPKKQIDPSPSSVNKQNQQQPMVKTLPSIGHGGNSAIGDGAGGGVVYVPEPQGVTHGKIVTGTHTIHHGHGHGANKHNTLPLFNSGTHLAGSGVVAGSSLPPIAGGGNGNTGDQSSRSNRSLQQQQQQQQQQSAQKKKKKNYGAKGSTYSQQDSKSAKKTGEVLRTYGLVVNGSHSDDLKMDLKSSGNNSFATQSYLSNRNKYPQK